MCFNKKNEKKKKERKEFKKVSGPLKLALKYMFKKYGYVACVKIVEQMKQPTINEKQLMLDYLQELNNK